MIICHSISGDPHYASHSNYNTRQEVLDSEGPISFDGVYTSVWKNRDILEGRGGILFPIASVVGGDNTFDEGQPYAEFCTISQLWELMEMGFEMGFHTKTHRDLTLLTDDEVMDEITHFGGLAPVYKHFAPPYGKYDDRIIRLVKEAGYENMWVLGNGDDSQFQRRRWHI